MKNNIVSIALRYAILVIIGIIFASTDILYTILHPLTIYPVYFLLNIFYEALISNSYIFVQEIAIEIIPACIAVSAYFLLVILNLATPMPIKKRTYSLVFSVLLLLLLNILRIFILSILLINEAVYFDIVHKLLWYVLSIVIVVAVWFFTIYLFKIKDIPGYSDIRFLLESIKQGK